MPHDLQDGQPSFNSNLVWLRGVPELLVVSGRIENVAIVFCKL